MKMFSQYSALRRFGVLFLLLLSCRLHAGVTVTQGLNPGATNWPATPIISTTANPSSDTVAENVNGGGNSTNLSQTFTVTGTNYLLQTIDIYISGGNGGALFLSLYDLGTQLAPSPASYTGNVNLLGAGGGLTINYTTQATSILQFAFSGADQVYLQAGHLYAFEIAGSSNPQPIYWERSGTDTYPGGAAYRNGSWLFASSSRDFALAVYANATTNPPPLLAAQCLVDWNSVFQRIDGFGASSAWQPNWTTAQADMFFSTNKGIGLSLLRNHIVPGGNTVETNIMQMAQARGARVWSTPWSPPASCKGTNALGVVSVNGGAFVSSTNNYQNYANQLASYVETMKTTYGINLYAISMQNEPDVNTTNYESCVWTSQQFHDFIPYLYSALSNHGVGSTRIITAEDEHWQFNLTANTMSDSNTAAMVGILAAHNYGSSVSMVTNYGKELWETEISLLSGNDSSITNAVYWAGQIHQFLTIAQVNAWHYWWLINGNSTGNESLMDINGTPAKRMYALGNFSKFIRPNFYRIGVITNTGPLQISAYMDPVSSNFVLVAINSSTNDVTQTFNFANFTANSVTPWITSSNLSLASNAPISVAGASFSNVVPAMSVVSFVGQSTSTTFSTARPELTPISQAGKLVLTWPTNNSGLILQYSTTLDPVAENWMTYPFSPVFIGDSNVLTNTMTDVSPLFFRLKKP